MKELFELFKSLPRSVGPWLSRWGNLYAAICGLIAFVGLNYLELIPTGHISFREIQISIRGPIFLVVVVFAVLIRLIIIQVYLRTGGTVKIGLAFNGEVVRLEDWNRTVQTLKNLSNNSQIKSKVSFRFIPSRFFANREITEKYMKRYKFTILTEARHSSPRTPNHGLDPSVIRLAVNSSVKAEFVNTSIRNTISVFSKRRTPNNLYAFLDNEAQTLYVALLQLVAGHYCFAQEFENASIILRHLDHSLEGEVLTTNSLRLNIRELDVHCRLARAQFKMVDIPPHDELEEILSFAEGASKYENEFYLVPILLARANFLVGKTKRAIALTEFAIKKIEKGELSDGSPISNKYRAIIFINKAFLSFLQGEWSSAAKYYSQMLEIKTNIDWEDLVEFIDYVAEFEHEGFVYLQHFYRVIDGKQPDHKLISDSLAWVSADSSRSALKGLLEKAKKKGSQIKASSHTSKRKKRKRPRR